MSSFKWEIGIYYKIDVYYSILLSRTLSYIIGIFKVLNLFRISFSLFITSSVF